MAFIRTPDNISIELLQAGEALPPAEPWKSMPNTGVGEARVSIVQRIAALTRLRKSDAEIFAYSGACTIRIANSESRGETQNAVPAMPPQKYSPTAPAVGARPGIGAHREAEAEAVAGREQRVVLDDVRRRDGRSP